MCLGVRPLDDDDNCSDNFRRNAVTADPILLRFSFYPNVRLLMSYGGRKSGNRRWRTRCAAVRSSKSDREPRARSTLSENRRPDLDRVRFRFGCRRRTVRGQHNLTVRIRNVRIRRIIIIFRSRRPPTPNGRVMFRKCFTTLG